MKGVAICATVLSAIMPMTAANAVPTDSVIKQSVCIPVIVDTPEGPVEGVLCFPQGGRV